MLYITGDTHRDFHRLEQFCLQMKTTRKDGMIVLGDAGINYCLDENDRDLKKHLRDIPITFFFVHGNHEERPSNIKSYIPTDIDHPHVQGRAYTEPSFPNLVFLDNTEYNMDGKRCQVIGGAYSVDKPWRLAKGHRWFESEELTQEEMERIYEGMGGNYDYILSHTCPERYVPTDRLLSKVDQSTVSRRMEVFLDAIATKNPQAKWYCGHWHINRKLEDIQFLFGEIKCFGF